MTSLRTYVFTTAAMLAFAGNSLLCRQALRNTEIDAASFTLIRLASGAAALWLLVRLRGAGQDRGNSENSNSENSNSENSNSGSGWSALALVGYAAGFSFAYLTLPAGVGALLLFGAVQVAMIGYGLYAGERLRWQQWAGLALAIVGLVGLVLPGLSAPPLIGALLMFSAGIAWGVYSLRGKGSRDPLAATAGNFLLAVPWAVGLSVATFGWASWDSTGAAYAVASGALTSGLGYAIWYTALRGLNATIAATVQLSVPVLAAGGGVLLLGEQLTSRLLVASLAILGGIAIVACFRRPAGK